MERKLAAVACVFSCGIAAAERLEISASSWLALTGLAILLGFVFLITRPKYVWAALLVGIWLWGAFWYSLSMYPLEKYPDLAGEVSQGQGSILSYPRRGSYAQSFIIKVERLSAGNKELGGLPKLLISIPSGQENTDFRPGDRISFQGRLIRPTGSANPGQFDYQRYLANQQIFYQVDCQPQDITVIRPGQGLRALAAQGRSKVAELLSATLPPEERILLMGILFGDISGMGDDERSAYQRAGVSHLFAVSGFNVAFVLGVLWFFFTWLHPSPWVRLSLALPVLWGYYFLVGWSASIVRASLMAALALTAVALGRKKDVYTALAAAALVILAINPGELFQAGFQLSFVTTAGLAYLTPWLQERGIGKYLAPALAAQVSSMPLIAYYFNLLSLVAPLLNILAALISGLVTVLGLVGTILTWLLPILAKPVFLICGLLMFGLSRLILWFAHLDWAALVVPSPSLITVALSYLFLAILPYNRRLRPALASLPGKVKFLIMIGLSCTLVLAWLPGPALMEVTFLDVGQGDSIFIHTPGGKRVLVDGGGTPESSFPVGERVVLPYLRRQGIRSLDAVIMSHNHLDHSEGLLEVLAQLDAKTVYLPPREPDNPVDRAIRVLCQERGLSLIELTAGQKLNLEKGVVLEVLHPLRGDNAQGNNHSLVLRLAYGDSSWLLTGDLERDGLEQLLSRKLELQADILKLPHHGSLSSYHEPFYRQVSPQAVVASAGSTLFNHPHPRVVDYFADRGITVYATKYSGAIITRSNGRQLRIYPYRQQN